MFAMNSYFIQTEQTRREKESGRFGRLKFFEEECDCIKEECKKNPSNYVKYFERGMVRPNISQ